jgi:hypothetical protein
MYNSIVEDLVAPETADQNDEGHQIALNYENSLKNLFHYIHQHYRQNALLRKGLMELPKTKNDLKDDYLCQITQVEVFKKTHVIFRAKKNQFLPKIMDELTDGDDEDEVGPNELITLFLDAIHVWDKHYALKELEQRWVDHVRPGQGQQEHMNNFRSYFEETHRDFLKGVTVNIEKFTNEVMKKLDREGDGSVNAIECIKSLVFVLESLIEWYNASIFFEAEKELGEILPYKYFAPKMKDVWLEQAQTNDAAREKVLVYFWKSVLLDIRQAQYAKNGMLYFYNSPKDEYKIFPTEVTKAIVEAQFRHRGGQNLRYLWQCYKDPFAEKIDGQSVKTILDEAADAWKKVAPRTVSRKWADLNGKDDDDQADFQEAYINCMDSKIDNWNVDEFLKKMIGSQNYTETEIPKSDFINLYQKEFVPFIVEVDTESRKSGVAACSKKGDGKDSSSEKEGGEGE